MLYSALDFNQRVLLVCFPGRPAQRRLCRCSTGAAQSLYPDSFVHRPLVVASLRPLLSMARASHAHAMNNARRRSLSLDGASLFVSTADDALSINI